LDIFTLISFPQEYSKFTSMLSVKREGVFQIPPLDWSFAFGFAISKKRTLSISSHTYNSQGPQPLAVTALMNSSPVL